MRTTKIFQKYIALILLCGWISVGYTQIPSGNEGVNYQAIARDGTGDVMVSTALTVTVDIKTGDPIPVSEYTETHAVVTNAYGQFSLVMGEGTPTLGTFDDIDWAADKHWYGISIFDGSTTVVLPDSPFKSVPYAHVADTTLNGNTLDAAYDQGFGAGAGRIIEVDGMAVELEVDGGNDGLVIKPQFDGSGTIDDIGLHIDASAGTIGTGILIEHGSSFGIGIPLRIENFGGDTAILVQQMDATTPNSAVHIDNAGLGKALEIAQLNPMALFPAVAIDNGGLMEGVKVTQAGPSDGIKVDNMGGSSGVSVANFAGGTGISVTTSAGDGVTVVTDQTMSAIGKVMGGGVDASAAVFSTVPNLFGPDATDPTMVTSNMVGGIAAAFGNGPTSVLPTVVIGNFGSGNALTITSASHDSHVLSVESELGTGTAGAAKFFNTSPFTVAPNVVEMTSATSGIPGHAVLDVIPAATTDQAANFEGNVDVTGKLKAVGDVTVTLGSIDVSTGSVTVGDDVVVGDALSVGTDALISGDLTVVGTLSKGAGTFKIDHPMDPENKYLYHSFVESPDMMNIYNGNIETDDEGFAIVELPHYFDVLNINFRYQLTVIGSFAQAIIRQEVTENTFVIQTSEPNIKVSWMVTGVRNDDYARENRVKVEVEKEAEAKGTRLYTPIHP